MEEQQYPEAVCAVIKRGNKIVGVSRRDDHTAFSLPGGKVDAGWNKIDALYDEILHETNLRISSYVEVYRSLSDDGFMCITYLCEADGDLSNKNETPSPKGIGIVKMVEWEEVLKGEFGEYNRKVYDALNQLYE